MRLSPDSGRLLVKTYREGVAARAGHDLVLEVTRWEAVVDTSAGMTIELDVDARSLQVREGLRGVKPLTDRDRAEIRKNIDAKVLHGRPIRFRSTSVRRSGDALHVDGELTIGDVTRSLTMRFDVDHTARISGVVSLTQSDWGITPYRGLMGALRVRDQVDVVIDARIG